LNAVCGTASSDAVIVVTHDWSAFSAKAGPLDIPLRVE